MIVTHKPNNNNMPFAMAQKHNKDAHMNVALAHWLRDGGMQTWDPFY